MAYDGSTTLGEMFSSSRKKGKSGLPTFSVTLQNGLVNREEMNRKTDTNLSPEKHLLVKRGYIAYNMMRMWQGASGVANQDGIVSPAYVVLAPNKDTDSLYASYLFKSSRIIYLFWAYSYGLTKDRLRLYYNDFKKIPVTIPPKLEQIKIAQILSTWDKTIEAVKKLIANSQQQKKALMQKLLTCEKRLPGYKGNWNDSHLTEIAQVIVSPVDKKSETDEIPVELCNYTDVYHNNRITKKLSFMKATAKQTEIDKYTLKIGDVVITKDSETPGDIAIPALVSDDLGGVLCGYHLAIIRPKKKLSDGAYLSYLFSMPRTRYYFFTLATGATRFGLSVGGIQKAHFSLPPIEEQQQIAKVLSSADLEIETLQQKLEFLKTEKRALMQQLLTGKRRVKANA